MQHPLQLRTSLKGRTRRLQITIGDRTVTLDGHGIDEFIERLAYFRAFLLPRVPDDISATHRYHITIDPCWYVESNPSMEATVLFLRHVGLGWTGFALPDHDCREWLTQLRAAANCIETPAFKETPQW